MSVILGLGLASIFRRTCSNKKCLMFVPPEMATLKDDIFMSMTGSATSISHTLLNAIRQNIGILIVAIKVNILYMRMFLLP